MTINTNARLLALVKKLAITETDFNAYMRDRDDAYYRATTPVEGSKNKRRAKGDVVIPIVMSQVDSARAFLTTTFLAKEPIFSVVQHDAKLAPTAAMWNTLYENHARRFAWKSELSKSFIDMLKYGIGAVEVTWHTESQELISTIPKEKNKVILHQGNKLKRINLYDAFWDCAVDPSRVHIEGDYAGYNQVVSGTLLTKILNGFTAEGELDKSAVQAAAANKYAAPMSLSPSYTATDLVTDNVPMTAELYAQSAFADDKPDAKSLSGTKYYKLTTCYVRILPKEFGLAESPPVIYKLLVVNDEHLVVKQQQTHLHNFLPIVFGQALQDGLGYGAKSFSDNVEDVQHTASTLINIDVKAAKRALTDRALYNPNLVAKKDVENPNPSGKIPIKTSAIGAKLSDAYYPIPFEDRAMGTRTQQATQMLGYANLISGQNPVRQGQFVKGNKTDGQFQESMASSNERMFAMAINIEDTLMFALKEMTKINILQYQPAEDLVNRQEAVSVNIDPAALRRVQMEFSIADGMLSIDRLAKTDLLMQAIQMFGQLSAASQTPPAYDLMGMAVHMLEQQGIKGLTQFKIAQQPTQQPSTPNATL
jgi:hypothetical protein